MPRPTYRARGSRLARATALSALAVASAGCGGEGGAATATEPDANVVGLYTLVAHDGRPLPAATTTGPSGARTELTGGTLDLGADRGFALRRHFREVNAQGQETGTSTAWVTGAYVVRGRTVALDDVGDPALDAADATVSGTTLAYGPLTFRR